MRIKPLRVDAILPRYATDGSGCFDLFTPEDISWFYEDGFYTATIKTGWIFEIPDEYTLFGFSRSGHGFKSHTHLVNCVAVIDSDYRGEIIIKLICLKHVPPQIKAGMAIAQAAIIETPKVFFEVTHDELSKTERGADGFGSTTKS